MSSESAPITPAETPVMLPMIASSTPPLVSITNNQQSQQQEYGAYLLPVSMLPNMGVNLMHPSMLLAPPPPSPNSLGIRSNPEHSPLIMQQQPVQMQQK